MSRVFDPIVYSHEIGIEKPDVQAFATLARLLNLSYDQICYIDDSTSNVSAAEQLGMSSLLHTEGNTTAVVHSLRQRLGL